MPQNPMLTFSGFPAFGSLAPEMIAPALEQLLKQNRTVLAEVVMLPVPTWENFVAVVSKAHDELHQAWSLVSHLHAVADSAALRLVYKTCLPKVTRFWSEFGQNTHVYQAYQTIANSPQYTDFSPAQKKVIENALRDFKLSGVALPPEKRTVFLEIQDKLAELSSTFSNNVLDATSSWTYGTQNENDLSGLPDWVKQAASDLAKSKGKTGWLITLEQPVYLAIMTHGDNRALREAVYEAYTTRASDQGPTAGQWDNSKIMDEVIALRHQLAQLLDYSQFSEYSLATKMAPSPDAVIDFLSELVKKSQPKAIKEYAELKVFTAQEGVSPIASWDVAYFSEKLAQQKFAISQEQLRPYFPLNHVLLGLFEIAHRLYGIALKELSGLDIWHPSVQAVEISNAKGDICGYCYLDLYARAAKRDGAWMDECRTRARLPDNTLQLPIAYIVCNFAPPSESTPALLTHEEVLTLFHEFGHALHHLLTRIDYGPVSGTQGVPWDAIELPSQFFEHWAWEREGLNLISSHVKTGEPLPAEWITRLEAAKNFHSGLQTIRQLEFALFDFRIHHLYDPKTDMGHFIANTLAQVRKEVAVISPPSYNRAAHSFSHVFAGGYAAGYYSYKWAEVLACDAFSLFKEKGIFSRKLGKSFLDHLLAQGGLFDSLDAFIAFRGRKPDIRALLRYYGIE